VRPWVLEPRSRERERNAWKRGRRHAIEEAVIPIPGSIVDHIETSVLSYRKSDVVAKDQMYGIRMTVAVEPL
jgi:hypothetical protein